MATTNPTKLTGCARGLACISTVPIALALVVNVIGCGTLNLESEAKCECTC